MRQLALLYEKQGRKDLTEDLYWVILEGRIKMLGRNHSYTQGSKRDLENLLRELGKWGDDKPEDDEDEPTESADKGKGKVKFQAANDAKVDLFETPQQLRLQDLWEWDPNEKWSTPESRARRWSDDPTKPFRLSTNPLIDPSPPALDISYGWDAMESDIKSLGGSDDSGSVHGAF